MTTRILELRRMMIRLKWPTSCPLRDIPDDIIAAIPTPKIFAGMWSNRFGGTYQNALNYWPVAKRAYDNLIKMGII